MLAAPGDEADDEEPSKLAGISKLKKFKGDDLLLLPRVPPPPPLELDMIVDEFRTENGASLGDGG